MHTNFMEKNILIDFHAHILPGMDHGCDDVAMSIGQLKMAAEHKIDIVVATSHFYPYQENVESFLKRRKNASEGLEAAREELTAIRNKLEVPKERLDAARMNRSPSIRLGAEVLICSNIDKMQGIEELCIENSKVLLIEMPFMRQWELNLVETVVRLRDKKNLEVILAHGERYPMKEVEKLLERGFQMQLNVSSSAKLRPSNSVKRYIEEYNVTAFGSDIHGLHNSYNDFTRSMKKWGVQAERIMEKTRKLLGVV